MKSSFKVRPCRDLDEFSKAVFAIGQYFGMEPTEERMERFSKNLPIEPIASRNSSSDLTGRTRKDIKRSYLSLSQCPIRSRTHLT